MRIIVFLLVCIPIISIAQKKKIIRETVNPHSVEWSEGSILTTDEEEIKGLVRYNSKLGTLNYEYGNDWRSFTPRGVVAFEFYDEEQKKQRLFYSLEFEARFHFFELLFDLKRFAIISRKDISEVDIRHSEIVPLETNTRASQIEIIYFLDLNGEITPFLEIESIEKEGVLYNKDKKKEKIVDRDLLAEHLGPDYDELKMYIKENDLNMKKKDDLMKVFEYYASIKE